jgi:diguanylate cyclase (GGDEF)-like protein
MLDIDRFKQYNDTHGHLAGDEILRQIVSLLRQNSRAADLIARYGDEEFIVVLPETEATGALAAAEKIRAVLENHIFPQGRFTASLGVAHCATVAETTPETLIAMADQALYGAKHAGRNRVCLWESKPEVVKNG